MLLVEDLAQIEWSLSLRRELALSLGSEAALIDILHESSALWVFRVDHHVNVMVLKLSTAYWQYFDILSVRNMRL